jgi:hypothetical protein
MIVNLFLLADVQYGGFVSYTAHLYRALLVTGHHPRVFKVKKTVEKKHRFTQHALPYQNIDVSTAKVLAASNLNVITAAYVKEGAEALQALVKLGAGLVLHDPTELDKELLGWLQAAGTRVVTIRRQSPKTFERLCGLKGARFVAHPYVPVDTVNPVPWKPWNAVALSRLDFDKRTEMIVGANQFLPEDKRVRIYGSCNRMFTHHKIDPFFPKWEDDYYGAFPKDEDAAVKLAMRANYMVDLSVIKNDGGGTQYTFLEAWNAKSVPIIHKKWVMPDDAMLPGYNCVAVENIEELAAQLKKTPDPGMVHNGLGSMALHAPETIIPAWLEAFGGS